MCKCGSKCTVRESTHCQHFLLFSFSLCSSIPLFSFWILRFFYRYCCCVNAHKMHNVIVITLSTLARTCTHIYTDVVYSNTILIINQNMHAKWTMLWSIHSMNNKHFCMLKYRKHIGRHAKWSIRFHIFSPSNSHPSPLSLSFSHRSANGWKMQKCWNCSKLGWKVWRRKKFDNSSKVEPKHNTQPNLKSNMDQIQ